MNLPRFGPFPIHNKRGSSCWSLINPTRIPMSYVNSVIIALDRNTVLRLFLDSQHLKKWIKGLDTFRFVQGRKGKLGCRTEMIFQLGKKQKIFYQTLIEKSLPTCYGFQFDSEYGISEVRYIFVPLANKQTLVETHTRLKMKGLTKYLSWIAPRLFKMKSQRHLDDFKEFVESAQTQNL